MVKIVKFVLSQRGAKMPTYGRTSGVLILSVGALLGISEVSHHLPLLRHSIIAAVPHAPVSTCGSSPGRPPPKSGLVQMLTGRRGWAGVRVWRCRQHGGAAATRSRSGAMPSQRAREQQRSAPRFRAATAAGAGVPWAASGPHAS